MSNDSHQPLCLHFTSPSTTDAHILQSPKSPNDSLYTQTGEYTPPQYHIGPSQNGGPEREHPPLVLPWTFPPLDALILSPIYLDRRRTYREDLLLHPVVRSPPVAHLDDNQQQATRPVFNPLALRTSRTQWRNAVIEPPPPPSLSALMRR